MRDPLYFIEANHRSGPSFIEVDRDSNSRAYVQQLISSGEISARKVLEIFEPSDEYPHGQVRDVTAEFVTEHEDYRTAFTGQDAIDWRNDRRRALQMSE